MPRAQSKATKNQGYLLGAIYLSLAMGAVKVIGALYKLPIQNLLTEQGGAQYDAAYKLYATLFTLATAGLPVAISKMVSESETRGSNESKRIFQVAQLVFVIISVTGAFVMFFGASSIANILNAPGAVLGIRAIAPSVLLVGFICPFRGFYQGQGNMTPTAVSEILEAAGKLIFGVGLTYITLQTLLPVDGTEATKILRDQWGAAAAIGGVSVGMLMSAVYLMSRGKKYKLWDKKTVPGQRLRSRRTIAKQMAYLALPVMLASSVLSITNLIDTGMIRNLLVSHAGFTQPQMEMYVGAYSYSTNLFNLPAAFISTIAISLLPALTAFRVQGDYHGVRQTVSSAIYVTSLLAMPAAAGYITLAEPILSLLYPSKIATGGVAIAAPLLQILGVSVIFVCFVTVTNSILQAMGLIWVPIMTMGIGCLAKIICTVVLVQNPAIHINGGPIGTLICYGIISVLNLFVIIRVTHLGQFLLRNLIKPLFSALVMGVMVFGFFQFWNHFLGIKLAGILAVGMGVVSYLILLLLVKGLPKRDLELIPGGKKIARILKIQ